MAALAVGRGSATRRRGPISARIRGSSSEPAIACSGKNARRSRRCSRMVLSLLVRLPDSTFA